MARFGSGLKVRWCDVVRSLLVMAATSLYALQPAEAEIIHSVGVFITRGVDLLPHSGRYYILEGSTLTVRCYCSNDPRQEVKVRDLVVNGIHRNYNISGCTQQNTVEEIIPLVGRDNTGSYSCAVNFNNGTLVQSEVYIFVYNSNDYSVYAPDVQYGLFNMSTSLLCNATSRISNFHSVTWKYPNNTVMESERIGSLSLADGGQYTCEVFFSDIGIIEKKIINLNVLVPPSILPSGTSPLYSACISNSKKVLSVHFTSKNQNDTDIYWYKDSEELPHIRLDYDTEFPMSSWTTMKFQPIRRSDAGSYHVVIENTHSFIQPKLRIADITLVVDVTILPAHPTQITFDHISGNLMWTYHNITTDDAPQEQTLVVLNNNTTVVLQVQLAGDSRQMRLNSLVPGESYRAQLIARNIDGSTSSQLMPFITPPGAPSVVAVTVTRRANNTVHLSAVLHYTGGGIITDFVISFRYVGNTEWISLPPITATRAGRSQLVWIGEVVDDRFADLESILELQVQLINSNQKISRALVHLEQIDLPGAPREVSVITLDYTSITLRLLLSEEGSTPFTHVEAEVWSNAYEQHETNLTAVPSLSPGRDVDITIADLQEGTEYTITVAVYNLGGRGRPSKQIRATTLESPLVPVYGIALLVSAGGFGLLAAVVLVIIKCKKGSNRRRKKREYPVGEVEAEGKHFSSRHLALKSINKEPHSPISPCPPTPSTATSILSSRISPTAFCSTPLYPPSSTCIHSLHSGSTLYHPSQVSEDLTTPLPSFKFCTGSSRSNSVNRDSDFSNSNSPCTYTFSNSEEVDPRLGRTHDPMDLLRDHVPFLPISEDGSFHCSKMSHDLLRFTPLKSRLNSDAPHCQLMCGHADEVGFACQLRAQSTHSMVTTATHFSGSDSISTRDSLIFPRIEPNITDV